jgi:hypothetical protein
MPISFPDMASLERYFGDGLPPKPGETEEQYRERCAVFSVEKYNDHIQAHEVRTGKGWNKWDDGDKSELLRRGFKS